MARRSFARKKSCKVPAIIEVVVSRALCPNLVTVGSAGAVRAPASVRSVYRLARRGMAAMSDSNSRELAVLSEALRQLEATSTIEEALTLRNKAEAVRVYVKSAHLSGDAANMASELKLRAERKVGGLLLGMRLHGGDRKSSGHDDHLKLSDLGIDQNESKRWQLEASVPDDAFERFVESARATHAELSSAALLRLAHHLRATGVIAKNGAARNVKAHCEEQEAPPRSRPTGTPDDSAQAILELQGHLKALRNVLTPIWSESEVANGKQMAFRLVRRYVEEMGELIERLRETLRPPSP